MLKSRTDPFKPDPFMRIKLVLLTVFAIAVFTGCQTPNHFDQNLASGREIVLEINVYSQDAIDKFPTSLNDLVTEKLLKTVPRCLCQDGKLRDFIYVPGFTPSDGRDWVILATPPEMDTKEAIIFHADARAEIVKKEDATLVLGKSRSYLKQRDQKSP
jgi:hypothetical protein